GARPAWGRGGGTAPPAGRGRAEEVIEEGAGPSVRPSREAQGPSRPRRRQSLHARHADRRRGRLRHRSLNEEAHLRSRSDDFCPRHTAHRRGAAGGEIVSGRLSQQDRGGSTLEQGDSLADFSSNIWLAPAHGVTPAITVVASGPQMDRMPRDEAIRRDEMVRDQAVAQYRAQLPTQHPATLRYDLTGRETVMQRKGR